MWLVQLQYDGYPFYGCPPSSRVICACDTEEAAHAAGRAVANFYNHPNYGFQEHLAGVIFDWTVVDDYQYSVKFHEGEWK